MAEPQRSGMEPQRLPPEAHSSSSFRVLGIAMVVDQRGRPAKTVLRYPTSTKHAAAATGGNGTAPSAAAAASEADQEHLFYKLSGRQMAKLFRPKPSLTGQPMTLSVGGTVFCCCAVLLGEDTYHGGVGDSSNANSDPDGDASAGYQSSDDNAADELVLFSVIVALAPQVRTASSILPIGGWMMEGSSSGDGARKPKQQSAADLNILQGKLGQSAGRASESFLSVRRVHVSLGRLCRVLEREERRCRYVSVQASLFDHIRADLTSSFNSGGSSKLGNSHNAQSMYASYWQNFQETATTPMDDDLEEPQHSPKGSGSDKSLVETPAAANTTSSNASAPNKNSTSPPLPPPAPIGSPPPTASNTPGASPASLISSKTATAPTSTAATAPSTIGSAPATARQHRRANSNFSVSFEREITVTASNKTTGGASSEKTSKKKQLQEEKERLLELEQVILETCMAAPPTHTTINYYSKNDYDGNSNSGVVIEHLGNLARELVQVYHALGRNEYEFALTPASLLSGGEGVVYVNRHIAIAIEAVSSAAPSSSSLGVVDTYYDGERAVLVRPYQTLLFPNASPSELLESMTASTLSPSYGTTCTTTTAMAPRRLQQLLRMVHPQKSQTDIAVDTNLPLGTTLDLAAYLVGQGACIASSVLSRKIRLATNRGTERIRRAALPFAQQFGAAVHLFELVAFLTEPGRTLGDCMTQLVVTTTGDLNNTSSDNHSDDNADDRTARLRQGFLSCLSAKKMMGKTGSSQDLTVGGNPAMMDAAAAFVVDPINGAGGGGVVSPDSPHLAALLPHADDIEDLLHQMVVWLCSHKVLVQLQDYLIATFPLGGGGGGGSYSGDGAGTGAGTTIDPARTIEEDESMHQQLDSNTNSSNPNFRYNQHQHPTEHKSDTNVRLDLLSDDLLFQELLDSDCLSGRISVPACCWKTGLDPIKLYQFVARSPHQLSIVTRLPARGDDWEDEW